MKMKKIADEIENAINKQCFLPALALTLVIPDVCAQFDYPDICRKKNEYKGHKGKGAAYAKWYDICIGDYNVSPKTGIGLLDGWGCWKLRCGFLHNSSIDIDGDISTENTKTRFRIIFSQYSNFDVGIGGGSSVSFDPLNNEIVVDFDIATFCGQILAVLRHSYLSNKEFIDFTEREMLNYTEIKFEEY